jgi:hypothetical protein
MGPNSFNPVVSSVMINVLVAHVPRLENETSAAAATVAVNENFTAFAKESLDGVNCIFHDGLQVSIACIFINEVELASIRKVL